MKNIIKALNIPKLMPVWSFLFFLNIMQKLIFAKVNLNKKNSSCWKCTLWDFITFKGTLKIVTICTLNFRSMNMYHFLQSQDPIYGHGFIVWEQKGYILKSNYVPWFIWDIHAPTKRWASIKFQFPVLLYYDL